MNPLRTGGSGEPAQVAAVGGLGANTSRNIGHRCPRMPPGTSSGVESHPREGTRGRCRQRRSSKQATCDLHTARGPGRMRQRGWGGPTGAVNEGAASRPPATRVPCKAQSPHRPASRPDGTTARAGMERGGGGNAAGDGEGGPKPPGWRSAAPCQIRQGRHGSDGCRRPKWRWRR
ncbi:hypothetical protein GQ55_3G408800 [Panicum hallii var. hallii]|uniref:Uncharacterized protein n=1 Tax=Panicum hallii var. hallii TaxID=1504633 RepID=A0A2T7EH29_9POAL|nr:hypothetical protein GQ55_3G408800 [Panicum hallii var. hallii]